MRFLGMNYFVNYVKIIFRSEALDGDGLAAGAGHWTAIKSSRSIKSAKISRKNVRTNVAGIDEK